MPLARSAQRSTAGTREVYARLRSLIVAGRIAPGARLVETECARRLAVSRTPVREAMRRLAQEGLATVVGRGAKTQMAVAPATLADLQDLFAIIGALEGLSGRRVARLSRQQRRALASELTRLNATFTRLANARRRDFDRFFAAHDAFHVCLVERCATLRLRQLIESVRPQAKRYELLYATTVGRDFSASLREHRAIIRTIRSGSSDAVERAIRLNWSKSAERLARGAAWGELHPLGDYRDTE